MSSGKSWFPTLLLFLILFLALVLRFYGLDAQSLWNDEGTSVALAERDLSTIARDAAHDIHPPLYYWLLSGWLRLVGTSEVAARSLSALLGVVLVLLTYALGRWLIARWAGLAASFLAAISPFQIYYSQEARMYMLLAVLAASAVLALVWLVERESLAALGVLILLEAAGLYTHYSFVFVILVLNLAYGLWLVLSWRSILVWPRVARWALSQVGVVLLYLPWLPTAIRQATAWPNQAGNGIASPSSALVVANVWRWQVFGPTIETGQVAVPLLVAALVAVAGILFLVLGWIGGPEPRNRWGAALLVLWAGLPVLLMVVLVLTRDAYLKFLLVTAPAVCLLLAAGFTSAPQSVSTHPRNMSHAALIALRLLQLLAAVCIVAASVIALRNYYTDPIYARDDYRGIASYVEAVGRPGDAILLNAPGQQEVFGYYYQGELPVYALPENRPLDPAATGEALAGLAQPGGRVFALFWATDESDPGRFVEGWLDREAYKALDSWYGNVRFAVYAVPERTATGPERVLDVLLGNPDNGDEIVLLGYGLQSQRLAAGDIAQFALYWQAEQTPKARYKVYLHVLDGADQIVGQRDAEPGGGARLTTLWTAGEVVADNHGVAIHPATPPGAYRVAVGMYNLETGERLVADDGQTQVWLEPLTVERPPAPAPVAALNMQHEAGADMGSLVLLGYDAHKLGFAHQPDVALRPGDALHLNLYWQAKEAPAGDWQVNVQVVDSGGQELAGIMAEPVGGYPTSLWQVGDVWRGLFNLVLPGDTPPGQYRLQIQGLPPEGPGPQPYLSEPFRVGP